MKGNKDNLINPANVSKQTLAKRAVHHHNKRINVQQDQSLSKTHSGYAFDGPHMDGAEDEPLSDDMVRD